MRLATEYRVSQARELLGAAAFVVTMVSAGPAAAQQAAGANSDQLEEVVVTSEKRAENIQQVPIAVTAFSGQALQDKGIQDVSAMAKLTPNVNFDTASPFGGSNNILSASIRGIGQDDFAFNLDPAVGVYVDGIYYARTIGANQNLLDVDRVEILKGPQGTLFGRNTIGGAINIVTRAPGDEFSFDGQVTGGSFNRRDIQATADIPISDDLLSTITFASLNRDGYQRRVPYPSAVPYVSDPPNAFHEAGTETFSTLGGQGENVVRAKFQWKPADNWTVTAQADWTHVDESSVPESPLTTITSLKIPGAAFGAFYNLCLVAKFSPLVCGERGPGLSALVPPAPGALLAGGNAGVSTGNPSIFGADLNPATYRLPYGNQFITSDIDESYATGHDFDNMDSFGGSVTVDWALAPNTDLKSISGYRRLNWKVGLDADGSPLTIVDSSFSEGQHQFSQELQLVGSLLDEKLKYSAGLYYFNEGGFIHDHVNFDAGLFQVDGPNYLDTSSYAAYSHVDYSILDDLTLILGARYSYDHKNIIEEQHDLNAFSYKISGCYPVSAACAVKIGAPVPGDPLQYVPLGENTRDFFVFTPTAGLQYQFTPDLMAYFTYSKGYKDGGWTTRVTKQVPADPSFAPEKAQTYEVGLKSEWFDHRLLVDVAGFYTQYDGIQLNFEKGLSPTIENAGNAEILGSELEAHWLVGGGFSLSGTAGYIDAYYTSLADGINAGQACVQPYEPCFSLGSKLPKTPKFKFSLSPTYEVGLPNESALRFGVDYTHTSSIFNDALNTSLLRRPDTDVVNASVTYVSPDDQYEVVAGGTNITDDRFITSGNASTSSGVIWGSYNPPAEWYLTLRAKFRAAKAPEPMAPVPAPPPAVPPAPAAATPEPDREFQVFFDFDKSVITDAAARVIQAAAESVKQGNVVHVTVTGHTDTVGSAAYNQGLSERRAAAVKTQLVTDGVADGSIATTGVGKTGLLVPTADGVREPQNRRAVIDLR